MNAEVAVRPADRLEAHCAAAALRGAGVEAAVETAPPLSGTSAALVLQLVWASVPTDGGSGPGPSAGRPVLYCTMAQGLSTFPGHAPVVDGYVDTAELVAAVRAVLAGAEPVLDPVRDHGLTDREQEVAWLVAQGLTNEAIAQRLGISYHTARTHVQRVLAKLGVRHRFNVAVMVRSGELRLRRTILGSAS